MGKKVSYNGRTLWVTGDLNDWNRENSIQFTPEMAETGELRIEAVDDDNENHCHWGGLLLHCQATDTTSPWHDFKSDTEHWTTLDGSALCSNIVGPQSYVSDCYGACFKFVTALLDSGAKKIWSHNKAVTLIGKPS